MGFFYFIGSCGAQNWNYTGLSVELLNLIGKGYVIDHCISLFNKQAKEEAYRTYVTDTLKTLNSNFAKIFGGNYFNLRYADAVNPNEESDKSGDEIARDIIKRAGLKVKT